MQTAGTNPATFTTTPDGGLLSETASGSTYYYLSDGAENVAGLCGRGGSFNPDPKVRPNYYAESIGAGHAFRQHYEEENQFPHVGDQAQFIDIIADLIQTGEEKELGGGRYAYYKSGVIVIVDVYGEDFGTAFEGTRKQFRRLT